MRLPATAVAWASAVLGWGGAARRGDLVGTPDPGEPLHGGGRPAELAEHRGVITTTVVSSLIAVAVAAAEWTGSGRALDTPTGILWSGRAAGRGRDAGRHRPEVRRRRQVEPAVPARDPPGGPVRGCPDRTSSAADRNRHLPVHRHRGLHPAAAGAGDRYAAVRDRHAAIVRQAVEAGGGVEVSTEGDLLCRVPKPGRGGSGRDRRPAWPCRLRVVPASQLRVRMGLHTGEGVLGGDNYVGMDVNRAARIAAAGHGGQVLVSEATRGLVEHALPEGASSATSASTG